MDTNTPESSSSHDPRPQDATAVAESATLSLREKIKILREMAYDAREMQVAAEEGMTGAPPDLAAIQAALRSLEADEGESPAKQ